VTAIWKKAEGAWELMSPIGFAAESALHDLVADAPMVLPLSGQPQLAVVGREVALGANYADLIALEITGRPVIIEVKLAHNAEARRAVVAQVLTYAAYIHSQTPTTLSEILASHLRQRGFATLADAAKNADQTGEFDATEFEEGLAAHLLAGSFRLVLVLDSAPEELVRLIGFLENVGEKLLIDLVTVSTFEVGGTRILVPQRVDPDRSDFRSAPIPASRPKGQLTEGSDEWLKSIQTASSAEQPKFQKLAAWAASLEKLPGVRLFSYQGLRGIVTLLPRLQPENAGLVSIYNDNGRAYLAVFRTVFERRAPKTTPLVESLIRPTLLGQGNTVSTISEDLLGALTSAYEEAVSLK